MIRKHEKHLLCAHNVGFGGSRIRPAPGGGRNWAEDNGGVTKTARSTSAIIFLLSTLTNYDSEYRSQ